MVIVEVVVDDNGQLTGWMGEGVDGLGVWLFLLE